MIKWLSRLFIVWVAIIFVASANEEMLYGWQQLVETSNEATSETTTGHAALPPIERESRTSDNALNTGKKARLQTDNLLKIGLGRTTGAYHSYPNSFGQSSRSGTSVFTENPIHFANNLGPFKFNSDNHRLFPSGVGLEQVNSQASSSTTMRYFLSDFDKTHKMDASASTKNYIPSPTNPTESNSEPFNLGRKTQLQSDAPITRGPLGISLTHEQDGGRGIKRKSWNSWGQLLSLKTGVTLDENGAPDSHATRDFLSDFPSEQLNRMSSAENRIAIPRLNPQELQQVMQHSQMRSKILSYQNAGDSTTPVLSEGGRIPWETSSMDGQNGGNDLISLKPSDQGENAESWGADQGTKFSPRSQPKNSLRAEQNISVNRQSTTEHYLNQSPRPQHNFFELGKQGSSSENPEHISHVSKIPKPHQSENIMPLGNPPSQIDGITNYGRLKFNADLFKGEGPYELERRSVVKLLDSVPIPSQGNFLFTGDQLSVACDVLKRRHSIRSSLSLPKIRKLMDNIDRWYQYWNTHAKIDLEILHHEGKLLRFPFIFPLFLLYVEMIISIIPFKKELPLGVELDYPQEMRNAINSYHKFNILMQTPPDNEESQSCIENQILFKERLFRSKTRPCAILWTFIEFWIKSHYTGFWSEVKEYSGFHACHAVKIFFNSIFTNGIETLNEKLRDHLPHE